jgi:hypothetical protein
VFFRLKELQDYQLQASDGPFGEIRGFIIDDFAWRVRYMIVVVGSRNVLLSSYTFGQPDPANHHFPVNVTREKVMNSPALDPELKLSREMERRISDYFEWPYYWDADDVPNTRPGDLTSVPLIEMELDKEQQIEADMIPQTGSGEDQPHLRNTREILGYTIYAENSNSNAGKLDDLIANGEDWNLLYLVADTGGLLSPGKKVLVSPQWVDAVDEEHSRIVLNLKEETIRNSPEFATIADLTDEYRSILSDHYDK